MQHSHIINLILSPLAPKEKNNDQFGITALHVAHLFRVKNHGSVVLSDQAHFLPHFKGSVHYVYFLENKYIQYIKYYLVTLYPCEISILLAGSTEPFSSSGIRFALSAFFYLFDPCGCYDWFYGCMDWSKNGPIRLTIKLTVKATGNPHARLVEMSISTIR